MPKKTTILIVILAVVTGVLLFLAVSNQGQPTLTPSQDTTPTPKVVEKTSKVFFSPQNIDLSQGQATTNPTVDLIVDTGGSEIAGVQAELQYDPAAITNVQIVPAVSTGDLFGPRAIILFNEVDEENGRISFAIAINAGDDTVQGVGKIGTLNFERAPGSTAPSTTVNFLDKTLVTMLGENESVLKEASPLNIFFGQTPTTQFVPINTVIPTTEVPPVQ